MMEYFEKKLDTAIYEVLDNYKAPDFQLFKNTLFYSECFNYNTRHYLNYYTLQNYIDKIKNCLLYDFIFKLYIDFFYEYNIDSDFIKAMKNYNKPQNNNKDYYESETSSKKSVKPFQENFYNYKKNLGANNFNILSNFDVLYVLSKIIKFTTYNPNITYITHNNLRNIYKTISDISSQNNSLEKSITLFLLENYLKTSCINALYKFSYDFPDNDIGYLKLSLLRDLSNLNNHTNESQLNNYLPLTTEKLTKMIINILCDSEYANLKILIYDIIPEIYDKFKSLVLDNIPKTDNDLSEIIKLFLYDSRNTFEKIITKSSFKKEDIELIFNSIIINISSLDKLTIKSIQDTTSQKICIPSEKDIRPKRFKLNRTHRFYKNYKRHKVHKNYSIYKRGLMSESKELSGAGHAVLFNNYTHYRDKNFLNEYYILNYYSTKHYKKLRGNFKSYKKFLRILSDKGFVISFNYKTYIKMLKSIFIAKVEEKYKQISDINKLSEIKKNYRINKFFKTKKTYLKYVKYKDLKNFIKQNPKAKTSILFNPKVSMIEKNESTFYECREKLLDTSTDGTVHKKFKEKRAELKNKKNDFISVKDKCLMSLTNELKKELCEKINLLSYMSEQLNQVFVDTEENTIKSYNYFEFYITRVDGKKVKPTYDVSDGYDNLDIYIDDYRYNKNIRSNLSDSSKEIISLKNKLNTFQRHINRLIFELDINNINNIHNFMQIHHFVQNLETLSNIKILYSSITETYEKFKNEDTYKQIFSIAIPYLYATPKTIASHSNVSLMGSIFRQEWDIIKQLAYETYASNIIEKELIKHKQKKEKHK